MKIRIRSITAKISIVYLLLAAASLALVCMVVYENQADLISQNARLRVTAAASDILSSIDAARSEAITTDERVRAIIPLVGAKNADFALFTEQGEILYKEGSVGVIGPEEILAGIRAVTGKDFAGKRYYSSVDARKYTISFYAPVPMPHAGSAVLMMQFSIREIPEQLTALYRQLLFLIAALGLLHLIVGSAVYAMVIAPMKHLHRKSVEIAHGDLSARTSIRQDDEIGDLGRAFNQMAGTIQEKITALLDEKRRSEDEMIVAGDVQRIIFPDLAAASPHRCGVFHRPFSKVSGDYFDLFPLAGGRTGFLMADVSGHGVPAALLTMVVKQIFRQYAHDCADPAELFRKINTEVCALLCNYTSTIYFTAFYAVLAQDNTLSWCKAGHLEQYLISGTDGSVTRLTSDGIIVGVDPDVNGMYRTESGTVRKGDTLVLLTDGILEACGPSGEAYGEPRFADALKRHASLGAEQLASALSSELESFISGLDRLKDDATIFTVRIG